MNAQECLSMLDDPTKRINVSRIQPRHMVHVMENGVVSTDGYLPLNQFNANLYESGMMGVILENNSSISYVGLDAQVKTYDDYVGDFKFALIVKLKDRTVQWESTFPDFPSRSPEPLKVGHVLTYAAFGRGEYSIEYGEIAFLLNRMYDAIESLDLIYKHEILEVLQDRT
ncbi:MAG TPA: hypothetical protein VMR81_00380 [Patescibacteria group bacterium]|nr:hypothetical protein [Patescibacteria group bacterium]